MRFLHAFPSRRFCLCASSRVEVAREAGGIAKPNFPIGKVGDIPDVDVDELFVKTIYVDGGPVLRRFLPRAHGRATRILKRTSHITVELGSH